MGIKGELLFQKMLDIFRSTKTIPDRKEIIQQLEGLRDYAIAAAEEEDAENKVVKHKQKIKKETKVSKVEIAKAEHKLVEPAVETQTITEDNRVLDKDIENTDATNISENVSPDEVIESSQNSPLPDNGLNPEQQYAVNFNGKHLLVIAGAGTGKTRTIIERAKYLVNKGVPPSKILILSFTRKSAREIVERIKLQYDSKVLNGLQGQTFHSWCLSLMKNNPNIFKQANCTVLDEDDRVSCIKVVYGRTINIKGEKNISAKVLLNVYSYAMNAKCSLSEAIRKVILDNAPADSEAVQKYIQNNKATFAEIISHYIRYKQIHNYLDYDDILSIVSIALKENKHIRDYFSSQYEHILVDEMQDTNPLQYELLSSFYDKCHLFCVGDDAQSIYGFRGADFNSIHRFTDIVPDSESCKLTINYRSTQEILDLSNWLLNKSPLKYNKELHSVRGNGNKPIISHWYSEWEEANHIANLIFKSAHSLNETYRDNMVLSRTVMGLRKVEAACLEKNIPYAIYGGGSLMQSAHVRDILSPLRVVANYLDEIAWMRYLQLWKGIGEVTATKIIEQIITESDFGSCITKLSNLPYQPEIADVLKKISKQQGTHHCMRVACEQLTSILRERYIDSWDWRKQDVPILIEMAKRVNSISEFISEFTIEPSLGNVMKQAGKDEPHCILSTIHSAKGLEAKNCYLVNVSAMSYPTPRAVLNGDESIEEERRCLYVALTRAKDKLYICRDIKSMRSIECVDDTNKDFAKRYFLNDLPSKLADIELSQITKSSAHRLKENINGVSIDNNFDFS